MKSEGEANLDTFFEQNAAVVVVLFLALWSRSRGAVFIDSSALHEDDASAVLTEHRP